MHGTYQRARKVPKASSEGQGPRLGLPAA
jgi:hypothetical protein